jgi:hypothetical protein
MIPDPAKQHTSPEAGKNPLPSSRHAKPLPPDHWIYQGGPQFGFVRALPASLQAALDRKKSEDEPNR